MGGGIFGGGWVGANKNNSHFSVSVEPGEHHICANVQSKLSANKRIAFAHFSAKAGGVLYFRTRFNGGVKSPLPSQMDLEPIDSDEAQYLIATSRTCVAHPEK